MNRKKDQSNFSSFTLCPWGPTVMFGINTIYLLLRGGPKQEVKYPV